MTIFLHVSSFNLGPFTLILVNKESHKQGRIQDFKLGGRTYKKCWGISCEKSIVCQKNHIFSNFRGATPPPPPPSWIHP